MCTRRVTARLQFVIFLEKESTIRRQIKQRQKTKVSIVYLSCSKIVAGVTDSNIWQTLIHSHQNEESQVVFMICKNVPYV